MQKATGFQIAFLVLTVQFLAAAFTSRAAAQLSWAGVGNNFLTQAIVFPLAIVLLAAVGPLRRACVEELRRPLPQGVGIELALVTIAKIAIPLAVIGGTVIWAFALGEPSLLARMLYAPDPMKAWESTLSAPEIARLLLLTWTLGPVVEELVFRGFLFRAWERQWGWIASLILTSACFALSHPSAMIQTFLSSVLFICVLRRTGTLRACILVHMAYNFLVSWPLLGQYILTLEGRELARMSTWTAELASLVFVVIALPVYLALSRADARTAAAR